MGSAVDEKIWSHRQNPCVSKLAPGGDPTMAVVRLGQILKLSTNCFSRLAC